MQIVFDHPSRQFRSAISRSIAQVIGAFLIVIGLLATVIAVPTGLVLVADVINTFQPEPEDLFEEGFPLREAEGAFVVALLISIAGLRYGRRLVRGRRSIVLFLRRFGYDGSMQVVTYAVASTVGVSWRLVTLDDDEIAPLGVDTTASVVIGTGERLVSVATRIGGFIMRSFPWPIWGMCAVIGLQVLAVAPDWERLLENGTADRYASILASIMDGRIPFEHYDVSLPGAFAILATALAIGCIGLLITFVTLLAMLPLMGFVIFATSVADALRKAEQERTATIKESHQIAGVASDLVRRGTQTLAPRLIVVRVASAIWQPTVSALAGMAAGTIVDISEPTPHLAWEIQEIDRLDAEDRCIFIVDHSRVEPNASSARDAASIAAGVARMVGDREVLAYTTDRRGMRRFARALHGRLLDLPGRVS